LYKRICYRYFIFTSFWAYKIYYVYGFMLLVFLILIVVTVCVTIVCTYFLLNAEDYRWFVLSFVRATLTESLKTNICIQSCCKNVTELSLLIIIIACCSLCMTVATLS